MRALNAVADRLVRMVAPRVDAMAACSGCYYVCTGRGYRFRCCYKANCTDTCSRSGYC